MSEIKQAKFNPVIPEEWQDKYADIKLTRTDTGEYLYGMPKDGGRKVRLSKGILDKAVEEGYSDSFKPEVSREELLEQQITLLENGIQALYESIETDNKQTELRLGKIEDVLKLVEKHLNNLGANTLNMRTLLDEDKVHVKTKEPSQTEPRQTTPEAKPARTIEELTRDNEAKDARIAELENRLAEAGSSASEVETPTGAETPPADPIVVTEEIPAPVVGRYPYRESGLRSFIRRLHRRPVAPEYYEVDETGRKYIVENSRTIYLDEIESRDRNGFIVALGTVALATLGFGIYTAHEVEEIEHRQSTPVRVVPGSVPKSKQSSGTNTVSEGAQDRDEPLSGGQSYNQNSKKDGHGLQLDIQSNMKVINNADGTHDLKFPNGKTIRLHWNTQGKLTSDTIRTLKANDYEVGQATSSFKDREGRRYQHAYSVVGDQDKD